MFGLSQRLNTILALLVALFLVVHCAPDSEAAVSFSPVLNSNVVD
jgi:hypothetical protein